MTPATPWTLSEIRAASLAAGNHFFTRQTMRFFGDTMRSFRIVDGGRLDAAGLVRFQRVRPMRSRDGCEMGGVGKVYTFNPATGDCAGI